MATPAAATVRGAVPRPGRQQPRTRILEAAQDLFAAHGIRAVGVDELVACSGVAKSTFYRHFGSKDTLIMACLEAWGRRRAQMVIQVRERRRAGKGALLEVFDSLDRSLRRGEAPGPLERVIVEMGADHPLSRTAAEQLDPSLEQIEEIAEEAGLKDPAGVACTLQTLICGSVVAASEGDRHAAARAKELASIVLNPPDG